MTRLMVDADYAYHKYGKLDYAELKSHYDEVIVYITRGRCAGFERKLIELGCTVRFNLIEMGRDITPDDHTICGIEIGLPCSFVH